MRLLGPRTRYLADTYHIVHLPTRLPAVAEHPHLQHIARSLRVIVLNLPRYSQTISLDPIFAALIKANNDGARHEDVEIRNWRDWTIVLLRIRCRGRSADVVNLNWICSDDPLRVYMGLALERSWQQMLCTRM
jgi:hypothetical protein